MQVTSRAYKEEQKRYLRNENYIYVYLGVISKEAQANATVDGSFTDYSDAQSIFGNNNFEAYYISAEENMTRCDASQYFLPRNKDAYALWQGMVTQDILGSVTFHFGDFTSLNIKGLTIDFGDFYPTSFTVTNGSESYTYTYTNVAAGEWTTEDEFLHSEYIQIIPHVMVGGQQRLRIKSILFGLGFMFDNTSLISTSWKSEVAHLSDSLPAKSFSFVIDNISRKFSADNPHSFVAFLEEQQEVSFDYGRKMDDDSIYIIHGGTLNLTSWSSDDQQAKFTAVGNMDYSTATYQKGKYYPEGISLYELAEDVCIDAGYSDYIIDTYLKKIITHNPLPVDKHKNILQLIANAARAILRETREGRIELKTSFQPDIIDISSNGQTDYSNLDNIVDVDASCSEYASTEQNFIYADGHQLFMPRDPEATGMIEAGYVSSAVSAESGYFEGTTENYVHFIHENGTITGITFSNALLSISKGKFLGDGISVSLNESSTTNPCLTIEFEAAWTFFNLTMLFSDVYPETVVIHTYKDDVEIEYFTVEDNIDYQTLVNHDFYDIDKIMFEFVKTSPYQRIHLAKIIFGNITDYSIDYRDMASSPTAVRTDFVKNVNVVYSEYAYGTEVKSISTTAAVVGENTYTSKTAHHDYSLAYKEITDDETTYNKVSKVYVDELPSADSAKSNTRYLVPTGSDSYYMYIVETTDGVKSWNLMATVTETIVSSLPVNLDENVLYLVQTDKNLVYHIYMLYNDGEEDSIISLGYVVRGTLTILDSGAYYLTYTSNVEASVTISGIEFLITETTYTNQMNEVGADKTLTNELIDNLEWAKDEAEWLAEYYSNDVEYTIQYRGEPALDPDDQIYIENQFVERNLVRITDTQIDTSTGMSMSCTLHGRRISYVEAARVDYAIVDKSEVQE
jgi:hypothetical protein